MDDRPLPRSRRPGARRRARRLGHDRLRARAPRLRRPGAARAFLEGALPGHDPFALGDMRDGGRADHGRGRLGRTHLRARRLRRRRHLRHLARRAAPARARRRADWHLPSRFEEGYGLASQTLSRLADDGVDLVLTVDCGITAVAEVEEATRLGLDIVVTDHHRPGRRRSPTALSSRRSRATIRSRASAAPASSGSSPRRCSARAIRSSSAISTWSRSRRSPTSSRSWTRTQQYTCSWCPSRVLRCSWCCWVLVDERHDVGDRRERDHVEVPLEERVARAEQRLGELPHDAGPAEARERIRPFSGATTGHAGNVSAGRWWSVTTTSSPSRAPRRPRPRP